MLKIKSAILLIFLALSSVSLAETTFRDLQNNPFNLQQLKGSWVIVNYWAGWCSNCHEEIPLLNQFYAENKAHSVYVVGVNFDHLPRKELKKQVINSNIQYPVLTEDPIDSWHLGSVDVIPTTFIISPSGTVVKKFIGVQTLETFQKSIR